MKEKMTKRIKGSISIFLVIIMVPMLCVSGLLVDGSRVELAKSSVSSAGDLTMNSALANYDTVLKDVYGLFAMSQSTEDLQNNLYKYFTDTLMANGIVTSEEEIQSNPLLQDIASAFSGQTSNLLSMDVSESDFTATKLENSSLANPEILKNQIIEYQKYRAPVDSALSLLDGIASLKKILNQGSVSKAKTEVDNAAKNLNEKCEDLYKKLKAYDTKSESFNPKYDSFTYNGVTYTYKEAYRENIAVEYVRSFAEAMPFGIGLKKGNAEKEYKFHFGDQHLEYTRGKNGKTWLSFSGHTTGELLEELQFAYERFETGIMQDATGALINASDVSKLSLKDKQTYATAYKMYMQKVYNLMNFYNAYMSQYNPDKDDTTFIDAHDEDIQNIFENAVKFTEVLDAYREVVREGEEFASNLIHAANTDIREKLEWFSNVDKLLEKAIQAIDPVLSSVDAVQSANGALKDQIDGYNGKDPSDAFSQQMEEEHKYYKNNIDKEKVLALKKQLEELRTYFSEVEQYLKSLEFAGAPISDADSNSLGNLIVHTERRNTTTGVRNIDYINDHIADGLNGLTEFYKTQFIEGSAPSETKEVSIKEDPFYKYLQQAFSVKPTDEDKQEVDKKEEMEDAAGGVNPEGTPSSFNDVSVSEQIQSLLPSQGNFIPPNSIPGYDGNDDFSSLFDNITSAVSGLVEGIKKAGKAGRDNLYTTQYVFDMFTYNTLEAECKVQNGVKDANKSLADLNLTLKTSSGITKNSTNNYMYGSEVEYILYGGFDAEANISSAKSTIFCIRFLANSGFAMTNSEIRSITLPPALSVQAATFGVVPYKLTQVVLQLCLALGESANDLKLMEKGYKVALIKTSDTWTLSPSGALNAAKDFIKDEIDDAVHQTADSVKGVINDLINAGTEKVKVTLDDFIQDMTVAINGQVEAAIGSIFSVFEADVVASLDAILKEGKELANGVEGTANAIVDGADQKAREIINSASPTIRPIIQGFYDQQLAPELANIKSEISTALSSINDIENGSTVLLNVQKKISKKIEDALSSLSTYVGEQTKEIVNELGSKLSTTAEGYIDQAADEILNVTNSFMDETFGSLAAQMPDFAGKTTNSSSFASILKFNYGDYLKMFVFLKLCVNDEEVLARIGDVIQLNINEALGDSGYSHPSKGNFLMSEAYTYVQIDAKVKLKTMFISLPFFTEYSGEGGSHFTLDYKSVLGY